MDSQTRKNSGLVCISTKEQITRRVAIPSMILIFLRFIFLVLGVCVCVCARAPKCTYEHVSVVSAEAEEGIIYFGVRVTDSCELPDTSTGN